VTVPTGPSIVEQCEAMSPEPTTLPTLAQMQQLRFEVALENMVEGLCFFDGAQRLILSNRRYAELYDLPPDQVRPGVTLREIVAMRFAVGSCPRMTEEEYHVWRNKVAVARQSNESIVEMMNGRTIIIKHQPMSDGGWVATHEDISERRRQEEELSRSRNHLSLAQRVSHTGSALRDRKTGVEEWSDELYHLLGIEPGTVLPTLERLLESVHADDRARVAAAYKDVTGAASRPTREYRIVRPNGDVRVVQSQTAPLSVDSGAEDRVLYVFRDVTELRAAEDRQRALELQLQHAHKLEALGTLAGGIAHDLNNTLVPVLALAKTSMRRLSADDRVHHNLALIHRAAERARDLVNQILAFSRKEELPMQPVALSAVVGTSLALLRASIPATIRIEEQIAAAPVVFANEGQLQQVLTNLVTNAAHAIGAEIGTIGIEIALGPRDGRGDPAIMARLSVTDSGPGMSETTLRRIFEPFYTTKAVGEGSGLGLAVVHGIVASHGGRVEVTSQLGKGTRFDILLPIIASDALSQPISPEKIAAVAE
jgi:PAS domain S-box-containing protein